MSITVVSRPIGVSISGTSVPATIDESYMALGAASVNSTAHGLLSGVWVYVKSRVENYNGFYKIFVINTNLFLLVDEHGGYVPYIVDADVTYNYQSGLHEWSAVFNPIVYVLKTNVWPNNTGDPIKVINSFDSYNGNVRITISASLGVFQTLDFIKITGAGTASGVYQIIDKQSSTVLVINLAYSSSYTLVSTNVQLYHRNYSMVVNVYAGFSSGSWASVNPIELVATLRLIPDTNNEAKFSIHEYIKAEILQRNGTLLATLPNNTDFWTQFYIKAADSYDIVDGGKVVNFTYDFVDDSSFFIGRAMNAKLPFKNRYSGQMTEYLNKFLTVFIDPVIFAGCSNVDKCYFDLSFIKNTSNGVQLLKIFSNNGVTTTVGEDIPNGDIGVTRVEIDTDGFCNYDSVSISIVQGFLAMSGFSGWSNQAGAGADWSAASGHPRVTVGGGASSDYYQSSILSGLLPGTYTVGLTDSTTSASVDLEVSFWTLSTQIVAHTYTHAGSGSSSTTFNVAVGTDPRRIKIKAINNAGTVQIYDIFTLSVSFNGQEVIAPINFQIECNCPDFIKLTWLNNLGGFEYWTFNAYHDHLVSIGETGQTSVNLLPSWPYSYGEFADTEKRRQTFRESTKQLVLRSQNLTQDQADALSTIKSSILVQIFESVYDKRTVIVDTDSFMVYRDNDKEFSIQFTVTYTDDIPSQTI